MKTHHNTQLFIGSSSDEKFFISRLATELKKLEIGVVTWNEAFIPGLAYLDVIEKQAEESDLFILVITLNKDENGIPINQNVLIEIGVSIGRFGRSGTILIQDPRVKLPSNLQGFTNIQQKFNQEKHGNDVDNDELLNLVTTISKCVEKYKGQNPKKVPNTEEKGTNEESIWWLSLMKAEPAKQESVIKKIIDFRTEAHGMGIKYEDCGVIWGVSDNYLLFKAQSARKTTKFLDELRWHLQDDINGIETRLVFPDNNWKQMNEIDFEGGWHGLILLSCKPGQVTKAYLELVKIAIDMSAQAEHNVCIIRVGITTGDNDIFFKIRAKTEIYYQLFIKNYFQDKISQYLRENTTSLPITNDALPSKEI